MSEIRTPDCPRCGNPPCLIMGGVQAFCDTGDCETLCWDMRDTIAEHRARAIVVDVIVEVGPILAGPTTNEDRPREPGPTG